ncbi:peptidoglycan-binding domain-containing protein [Kordia jejudonensis]|uniref:peptidoglycan-binding domain-containing protein n=1 Tax=Kordia jejudonensis TaxID=1348245 RepID=UPI00062947D1|nr:hypothetical protein [Kordia jejudonensis]
MKSANIQVKSTFFQRNKMPILIGGAVVVIGGAVLTYFLLNKKKEEEKKTNSTTDYSVSIPGTSTASITPPYLPTRSGTTTPTRSSSSKAVVKYGSRGSLVRVLQRYLKVLGADLGKFGAKRDGVDGVFGGKTSRAAKSKLGKTVFTTADIEKMKQTLKTLGK